MTEYPTVVGVVHSWDAEHGWGVLLAPDGTTVFCHFSHVDLEGYRELHPGERVEFAYRTPGQDGCAATVSDGVRPLP